MTLRCLCGHPLYPLATTDGCRWARCWRCWRLWLMATEAARWKK